MANLARAYYQPNKALADKIRAESVLRTKGLQARMALAKQHFGKNADAVSINEDGQWGVATKGELSGVSPVGWKHNRKQGVWLPDRSKAGKELVTEMADAKYAMPGTKALAKLLNFQSHQYMEMTSRGMIFPNVIYAIVEGGPHDGTVILTVPKKFIPKDCKRITDVRYDELMKSEKGAKRAKVRSNTRSKARS